MSCLTYQRLCLGALQSKLTVGIGEQITPENFSTGKRGIGGNSPCLMSRLSTPQLFFLKAKPATLMLDPIVIMLLCLPMGHYHAEPLSISTMTF